MTLPIPTPVKGWEKTRQIRQAMRIQLTSNIFFTRPISFPNASAREATIPSAGLATSFTSSIIAAPTPVNTIARSRNRILTNRI
jgi:hypothetical protein